MTRAGVPTEPLFLPGEVVSITTGMGYARRGVIVGRKWSHASGWWYDVRVTGVGTYSVTEDGVSR